MSTLYEIRVLKKEPVKLKLFIKVVHPDAMYIAATPGFALMILHNMSSVESKLRKEIDWENMSDTAWMKKYAYGFVKSVTVELFNAPPEAGKYDSSHDYYSDSTKWMTGIMDMEVTHAAWIEDIVEGSTKDSADFDPCGSYDACEPILPVDEAKSILPSTDTHEGFIPVWKNMFYESLKYCSDEIVWVPVYGEAAYVPLRNEVKEYSRENLSSLVGQYVKLQDMQGVIVPTEKEYILFQLTSGSVGGMGFLYQKETGPYSQLFFNKAKKRLPESLSLNKQAEYASHFVFDTSVTGDEVEFSLVLFSSQRLMEFKSATEALCMIAKPIEGFGSALSGTSPLAIYTKLLQESTGRPFISELYSKVAKGIVKEYAITPMNEVAVPELDSLTAQQIIENYKIEKWPQLKVRIKVSDPAWLEHLKTGKQFSYSFNWAPDAEEWKDEPILWEKVKPSEEFKEFNQSSIPARETSMDAALINRMATDSVISDDELRKKIAAHTLFLNSGGLNGKFERLEVSGMPMNVYMGNGMEGAHLAIPMKDLRQSKILKGSLLSKADLAGCKAEGTDFSKAILQGAMLTDGFFAGANFENADLSYADFTGSDLKNANFKNANLTGTDFEICDCSDADFRGAVLVGSSFKGTKLSGAKRDKSGKKNDIANPKPSVTSSLFVKFLSDLFKAIFNSNKS